MIIPIRLNANAMTPVKTNRGFKQGDKGIVFSITPEWDVSEATSASIVFLRANHTSVESILPVPNAGDPWLYTILGSEFAVPGKVVADVKFYNGDSERISTASFIFDVITDTEDGFGGSAEPWSGTLDLQVQDAEAYANGTRKGVPVSEDDPAYQENAKYWAQQSKSIASLSATIDDETGTPSVDVVDLTPPGDANKVYRFDFHKIKGAQGDTGDTGEDGNGIESVTLISGTHAPGSYDTYRIEFTDGTHFDFMVWNGENGEGSGDMTKSVYDPSNRQEAVAFASDLLDYADGISYSGNTLSLLHGATVLATATITSGPTVVQTTGSSTTDVMSQKACTDKYIDQSSLEYDPTASYGKDAICKHEGKFYQNISGTTVTGAWNGSYWTDAIFGNMATLSYTVVGTY